MMPIEYRPIPMTVKAVDRDPKTGTLVLTLQQHEASAETMRVCEGLVVGQTVVDVVVEREVEC